MEKVDTVKRIIEKTDKKTLSSAFEEDLNDREIKNAQALLSTTLDNMVLEIDVLKRKISGLLSYIDSAEFERFIIMLDQSISDFASANEAVIYYNIEWFKSLPFSFESKSIIADTLSRKISEYDIEPHPIWEKIKTGDLEYMEQVSFSGTEYSKTFHLEDENSTNEKNKEETLSKNDSLKPTDFSTNTIREDKDR